MSCRPGPSGAVTSLVRPAQLHELRTPLNALIGYSEMLLEDVSQEDQLGAGLEELRALGHQLLANVNDRLARPGPAADRVESALQLAMLRAELRGPASAALEKSVLLLETARAGATDQARLPDLERIATGAGAFLRRLEELLESAPPVEATASSTGREAEAAAPGTGWAGPARRRWAGSWWWTTTRPTSTCSRGGCAASATTWRSPRAGSRRSVRCCAGPSTWSCST